MNLFLIDAIGPFFIDYNKRVINWSKIPFVNLETEDRLDEEKLEKITEGFRRFVREIVKIGYNAITLDDLAHLAIFDFYPASLRQKLSLYQDFYRQLFAIAAEYQLKVFLNTDVIYLNDAISKQIKKRKTTAWELLTRAVDEVLEQFDIAGIVFRIGEVDGEDVVGDFKSDMAIKTPQQANRLIKTLLPLFERQQKIMIFRNWTVGSYPIGDLIWNRDTFEKTFEGIDSDCFIVSLKYGDTDFFSRLHLNPLFIDNPQKMILELQTRRERECFGVLPNYVGWEYEKYHEQLKGVKNLVGISVWCQTGGWSRNANLTFVENSSIWNELNTLAAIKIFKYGNPADAVVLQFFKNDLYLTFLKVFNDIFLDLLYIEDFANKTLYFRRTRIPPLLWLAWDYVTINPLMASIYMSFMKEIKVLDESKIEKVYHLGKLLDIENIEYCYDTLRLFLLCRKTLLGQHESYRLLETIGLFRRKYHPCNFKFAVKKGHAYILPVKLMFKIFTRSKPDYRWIDRILLNRVFAFIIYKLITFFSSGRMPKFSNKRAMKLDTLFK